MNTRINQNASLQYLASRTLNETKTAPQSSGSTGSGAAAQDTLSLSANADRLASLTKIAQASPDMDMAKVKGLQDAIAGGNYHIDAKALAGSMLTADRLIGR